MWFLILNVLIIKVRYYYKSIILVAKEFVYIKVIFFIYVSVLWIFCKVIILLIYIGKICGNNNLKDFLFEFIWLKWCIVYFYVLILVWKLVLFDDELDIE